MQFTEAELQLVQKASTLVATRFENADCPETERLRQAAVALAAFTFREQVALLGTTQEAN